MRRNIFTERNLMMMMTYMYISIGIYFIIKDSVWLAAHRWNKTQHLRPTKMFCFYLLHLSVQLLLRPPGGNKRLEKHFYENVLLQIICLLTHFMLRWKWMRQISGCIPNKPMPPRVFDHADIMDFGYFDNNSSGSGYCTVWRYVFSHTS